MPSPRPSSTLEIGDRESCNLFVRAMEYELNAYQSADACTALEVAPGSPATADEGDALQEIARTARRLADLIRYLPDPAKPALLDALATQDEMQRGYDQRYLEQLQYEITRLASASAAQSVEARDTAPTPAPQPATSEECLRLVSSLANIFEECFEQQPTPDPDGPFAIALEAIHSGTGIQIPCDRLFLELALTPTMGNTSNG